MNSTELSIYFAPKTRQRVENLPHYGLFPGCVDQEVQLMELLFFFHSLCILSLTSLLLDIMSYQFCDHAPSLQFSPAALLKKPATLSGIAK